MSSQLSLGTGFEKYRKSTRREQFLAEMEQTVPWGDLCGLIAPVYPMAGNGRPPKELDMMLRIYFLQQWFNLSDPEWKRRYMTRYRCVPLRGLIWGGCRCRMNRRFCASGIY